eukprot:CAMPEP_0172529858 /NCGR_PEP_ID=MMETSP1067-20121228/3812_1 /TAXON_ID=265564 ORGANISM="Thalassiosira punctigera, Strain Tpunct2005C2" /NCGR_SAMPLE_ID=MMETSP1067 /ASSEMBLY_ACC=CAM_ASM_000444 /LENGTH=355 /DNA_ID=CAMNT_0013313985 /DNA_START=223 /DNA_END=1290 /DNA_ORIENTATION=+
MKTTMTTLLMAAASALLLTTPLTLVGAQIASAPLRARKNHLSAKDIAVENNPVRRRNNKGDDARRAREGRGLKRDARTNESFDGGRSDKKRRPRAATKQNGSNDIKRQQRVKTKEITKAAGGRDAPLEHFIDVRSELGPGAFNTNARSMKVHKTHGTKASKAPTPSPIQSTSEIDFMLITPEISMSYTTTIATEKIVAQSTTVATAESTTAATAATTGSTDAATTELTTVATTELTTVATTESTTAATTESTTAATTESTSATSTTGTTTAATTAATTPATTEPSATAAMMVTATTSATTSTTASKAAKTPKTMELTPESEGGDSKVVENKLESSSSMRSPLMIFSAVAGALVVI